MAPLVVLLMPWGRVGSNLVNNVVTQSKMLRVWNEPLTGVQTRVISRGGNLDDVGKEQCAWLEEHVVPATEGIFLNIAANSLRSPDDVRDTIAPRAPSYIVLDRHDDLATAISALRTAAWVREGIEKGETRSWAIPSGESVNFRPRIAPEQLESAFRIISSGRQNIDCLATPATPRFFYEDLVADMDGTMKRLLRAAEIPPFPFKVNSGKFGSDDLRDMVDNADELAAVAKQHGAVTNLIIL